ncbi:MAG TPA: VTT domain-containing protein [Gemmatimonadales bacterium]|nr:VTT domain-containing protein [Gemmatimonadales bacterium]
MGRSRRVIVLVLVVVLAVLLMLARPAHAWLLALFADAESAIRQRESWGMVLFVSLAAVSAMFAFVSSAILVPVAIYVWGPVVCFLLLWTGWFLGGLAGYTIGRYLGRPVVERLARPGALARYEGWARSGKSLVPVLMIQIGVPSDLASYVFGLVRCRFGLFVIALALAEIPYALGAVYLGTSFLERRIVPLVALGLGGILLSAWALQRIHRGSPPDRPGPPRSSSMSVTADQS